MLEHIRDRALRDLRHVRAGRHPLDGATRFTKKHFRTSPHEQRNFRHSRWEQAGHTFAARRSTMGIDRRAGSGDAIAIFVADDEPIASRIVYVNDAFVRMTGYTPDQLIGHSALLLAGARPKVEDLRAAIEALKNRAYVAIERKARRDGSFYDAEVRLEVLNRGASGPAHVAMTQRELVEEPESPRPRTSAMRRHPSRRRSR
jgi:PAS domain S-box-containing protein